MIFNSGYVMSADLEILAAPMPQVLMLKPQRFTDSRGFFSESYNKAVLERAGISVDFVQDNLAYSTSQLTLRGIHFQREPFGQAKLVSVLQGVVLDTGSIDGVLRVRPHQPQVYVKGAASAARSFVCH